MRFLARRAPAFRKADDSTTFHCNICGKRNTSKLALLTREDPTCRRCGSTVRTRSMIHILTTELFGQSLRISEIDPPRPDIVGIGMSCWDGYAIPLARRVGYTNTFYHQEPKLDITNIPVAMEGMLDFVISTDVFEHVMPPVSIAFENAKKLLKPDGVLIFSVPFTHPGEEGIPTTEHFPDLHEFEISQVDGVLQLRNVTRTGETQHFDNLVFHGGPGSTLEMRVFSEWSLLSELARAGFENIRIYRESDLRHGIHWPHNWSVPIAARVNTKAIAKELPPGSTNQSAMQRSWATSLLKVTRSLRNR